MTAGFNPVPHTQIHVRNLQDHLPLSLDAWGRVSASQPVLISLSVSLRSPFSSAASQDQVEGSTVHYGILSKGVLSFCAAHTESKRNAQEPPHGTTLQGFASDLVESLFTPKRDGGTSGADTTPAILSWGVVDSLALSLHLPKASLLGSGVKLSQIFHPSDVSATESIDSQSSRTSQVTNTTLQLCDLKIPCVIGVNAHEREAKQVVTANVSLEGTLEAIGGGDEFWKLERIVTKAIEPSTFQTLEALTTHLTSAVITGHIRPLSQFFAPRNIKVSYPNLRILLEKPTAVTFADAPGVEFLVNLSPENEQVRRFWDA